MGWFSSSKSQPSDDILREARQEMVTQQLLSRGIKNQLVLQAMSKVPRHLFVPANVRDQAYGDFPLPIGYGQTISQPYVVGSMTELLEPNPKETVLEIGTGSGYQTAILAEIFANVVTIECISELSEQAQKVLSELGYSNIDFHIGSELALPSSYDSFPAIIVTAAPAVLPQELIDCLKPDGRMVIPIGEIDQYLHLVTKDEQGMITNQTLYPVRFVPLQTD